MKLVIVESPSKAKTIEKYLGDDYTVVSSVGHIRDLPKSNKNAVDIANDFTPHYVTQKRKEEVIAELQRYTKKADEVIIATDPDREGEAIAWHITQVLDLDPKQTKRIVFHEITKEAVQEALTHPRGIDFHLKEAQEARRVLDRLFGYELSGLIWKKVRYGLSAGRVQSPALRILVEHEREIQAFDPQTYYVLEAHCITKQDEPLTLTCDEEPTEKKEADRIAAVAQEKTWEVTSVTEQEKKRNPRAPFTTSTLQQAASSRLSYSPAQTMRIAQKLYEKGLITYMRTDSTNLSSAVQKQIMAHVSDTYGKDHLTPRTYATKSKNAQEAHEAIRPTTIAKQGAGASAQEKKLYALIHARTVASQMAPARLMHTKISAQVPGATMPTFSVTGSRVLFAGWLAADTQARGEDTELPALSSGDPLTLVDLDTIEKETQPPSRYSEARLVKELEKRGIGRPSTYASIIQTLIDRGYVTKEGRALQPTDTGEVVSGFLEENFTNYISDTFTASMEDELDDIARGDQTYVETLSSFYAPFHAHVEKKDEESEKITNLGEADEQYTCPKCGDNMVIKLGRGGKFLSCKQYPDCDGALTIDGEKLGDDDPIGTDPDTNEAIYVKNGPYGPYVQRGEKTKENKKPKRASIPNDVSPEDVDLTLAQKLLSLPRTLGTHPDTEKEIVANIGRYGPYIVHDGDFRSLKEDDVYTITLKRALEILREPKKKGRRGGKKKKGKK